MPATAPDTLETIDVSVAEVFAAIEKNGFTHLRQMWDSSTGGCVLAQGARNLSVAAHVDQIYEISYENDESEEIQSFTPYSLHTQLGFEPTPTKWSTDERWLLEMGKYNIPNTVANLIIFWNDLGYVEDGRRAIDVFEEATDIRWELPTYQDVVEMAREVLSPFFGMNVRLLKILWE